MGQRLSNTATVTFEDVEIEDDQIIGDRRLGFQYLTDVLDYARPMVAAIGVGLARRALDVTLAYTRERRQFGQRICDMPVARETLVAMWKRIELAEMALMKAAFLVQEGAPDRGVYASLAKNLAAEAADILLRRRGSTSTADTASCRNTRSRSSSGTPRSSTSTKGSGRSRT